MRVAACNAIACRAAILPTELFCAKHLPMLESDTRRVLARTFRPGRPQSATFRQTLETARQEILNYAIRGGHVPRNRPFEWDEEERHR